MTLAGRSRRGRSRVAPSRSARGEPVELAGSGERLPLARAHAEGVEEGPDDVLAEPPPRRRREPLHGEAGAGHRAVAACGPALRLDHVADEAPGVHAPVARAE